MARYLLDTNIIVRFLRGEPEDQAAAVQQLVAASDSGRHTLIVLSSVVAECVFVLESYYKTPKAKIAQALLTFLSGPGIELGDAEIVLDAFKRYAAKNVSWIDAYLAASSSGSKTPIATFDRDFRKFHDVVVFDPIKSA